MKTEIVPLTVHHLIALGQYDPVINEGWLRGIAFALLVDDVPTAAAGVSRMGKTLGYAWTIKLEEAFKDPRLVRPIHKYAKHTFPVVFRALARKGMTTIYSEANADKPQACRWLEWFGFKEKERLVRYIHEVKL